METICCFSTRCARIAASIALVDNHESVGPTSRYRAALAAKKARLHVFNSSSCRSWNEHKWRLLCKPTIPFFSSYFLYLPTCLLSLLKVIKDRGRAFSRSGSQTEIISLGKWGRPMALLPPAHFSHQYNRSFRPGVVRTFQDSSIWLNKSKILGTGFNIIFRN